MKSKLFLGLWVLIGVVVPFALVPVAISTENSTLSIIVFAVIFGNWCIFGFHLTKYFFYGVPVRRLEHKQSYRVIEQKKTNVVKDGKTKYNFHLTLINLNDNKTRFYLLESCIPIFDEDCKRLEKFPDAFKLLKSREWKFINSEPYLRTFYQVIEIPCP